MLKSNRPRESVTGNGPTKITDEEILDVIQMQRGVAAHLRRFLQRVAAERGADRKGGE